METRKQTSQDHEAQGKMPWGIQCFLLASSVWDQVPVRLTTQKCWWEQCSLPPAPSPKSQPSLLSLAKGLEIENIVLHLSNITERTVAPPHSCQQKPSGEPRTVPCVCCNEVPQPPTMAFSEKAMQGAGTFTPGRRSLVPLLWCQ